LLEGDVVSAQEGLGRPYSIRGIVVRGEQRGRTLGFPTANLEVSGGGAAGQKLIPAPGIYAVRGVLKSGTYSGTYNGALHLGPRPTFKGSPPSIELHLMDFEKDIYGEEVRVDFVRYLREIRPFDSQRTLIEQMREDVREARAILSEA
jgi:riboflavin kinase/FMN adenylyltransferase